MSRHDDQITLQQIRDHVREIQEFSSSKALDDFRNDRLLNLGLTRLLEIVGEAVTRLSQQTRDQHPQVPWSQIISLRNRLIHGYDSIDSGIIWKIIVDDIPVLGENLESILQDNSMK